MIHLLLNMTFNDEKKFIKKYEKENYIILNKLLMDNDKNILIRFVNNNLLDNNNKRKILIITDIDLLNSFNFLNNIKGIEIYLLTSSKWIKLLENKKMMKKINIIRKKDNNNNTESLLFEIIKNMMTTKNNSIEDIYKIYKIYKIYLPSIIHYNIDIFVNNDIKYIIEYLELYSKSEIIQNKVFLEKYLYFDYIYFILTIFLPYLIIKKKNDYDISKKIKYSNITSLSCINIITLNRKYRDLRLIRNTIDDNMKVFE